MVTDSDNRIRLAPVSQPTCRPEDFSFLVLWFRVMGPTLKRWLEFKLITSFRAEPTNDNPDGRR